jgi:hypothetical protein
MLDLERLLDLSVQVDGQAPAPGGLGADTCAAWRLCHVATHVACVQHCKCSTGGSRCPSTPAPDSLLVVLDSYMYCDCSLPKCSHTCTLWN